ncbi:uncharacterized protein [Typha angustifolia]|uniref:uncharacterized protein n=1 Tax=Typha angustifolia TaxID=59011 RepID=UPI003C2FA3BD
MANSGNSLSTLEILWNALVLPFKNLKLFLPLFLITFLSSSILLFSNLIVILPLLTDLTQKANELTHIADRSSPEFALLLAAIKKDVTHLIVDESVELLLSFIINSLLMILTLYATVTTYRGKLLSLVEVLIMAKNTIKGPILTQLFVTFLYSACFVLFILLSIFPVVPLILKNSIIFSTLLFLILLLAVCFFLYYSFVWSLGIVVSVAEIGCYGPKAIRRSTELIKGRKKQGFLLLLLITAFEIATQAIAKFTLTPAPSSKEVILLLSVIFYALVAKTQDLFILAIMTVFYSECKKSHEDGFVYSSLSLSEAHVDKELP